MGGVLGGRIYVNPALYNFETITQLPDYKLHTEQCYIYIIFCMLYYNAFQVILSAVRQTTEERGEFTIHCDTNVTCTSTINWANW